MIQRISKRTEYLTGLTLSTAEELQVGYMQLRRV